MEYIELREDLKKYYFTESYKNAEKQLNAVTKRLDSLYDEKFRLFLIISL